jgi:hypothetical protein
VLIPPPGRSQISQQKIRCGKIFEHQEIFGENPVIKILKSFHRKKNSANHLSKKFSGREKFSRLLAQRKNFENFPEDPGKFTKTEFIDCRNLGDAHAAGAKPPKAYHRNRQH